MKPRSRNPHRISCSDCSWHFLAAMGLLMTCSQPVTALAQGGPALVEVTKVMERDVATGQTFVGTILPPHRSVIGSAVDGRLIELMFDEGDRVEADQPLARLLTQTIELELEAAQAELDLRTQQLNEMENGSQPTEIEQTRARMERAKVFSEFRQKDFHRLSELSQRNASSQSELDAASSAALEAKEAYDEAKAAHQLAVDGPRRERIAQARAQVAMQDAVVRRLQDQIRKYTISSKFAGYVTVRQADLGAWVKQGDPIAEVIALDEVDVVVKVVDTQIPYVKVGDSARVEVPALVDQALTGNVAAVVPQADVRSRTFPVKVRVRNQVSESGEPLLKAGMLARVTLATGEKTHAYLVPKDALVLTGQQSMIWLVDPETAKNADGGMVEAGAVATSVRLGVADGDWIQVLGDIPATSLVVVKGNERIIRNRTGEPSVVRWSSEPAAVASSSGTDSVERQAEASTHVAD